MSQALVVLKQDSSAEEKSEALVHLEQRLGSERVSAVKAQVLRAVINFAKNNLVKAKPLDYPAALYLTCNAIFDQVHLPDLLFLHSVIWCLNALRNDTSGLKKAVLPMAQNYKRPLMLPLVRQMEKASFGFGVSALFMRNVGFNLPAIAEFFTSELSAENKIERSLDACLKSPSQQTMVKEKDFGEGIEFIFDWVNRSSKAALGLFYPKSLASRAIQAVLPGPRKHFQPGT